MAGEVVVITGASGGIGEATAVVLAERSARVVLVARRQAALDAVAARCRGRAAVHVADMTDRAEVRRVVAAALASHGGIDVWINNIGQGITRLPSELTDDDIDDMMRINVKSALYGAQEVLPHFKARGRGHIINVSSMLGRVPAALSRSAYAAAKHFLNALTAMMRDELKPAYSGIQISLVSPGVVRTEFGIHARYGGVDSRLLDDSQSAEEVGSVIADLVASRRPDVYTSAGAQACVADYYSTIGEDPSR